MLRAFIVLLALVACPALADEREALRARLGIEDVRPGGVGVYSRYRDGRPNLVVVGRYVGFNEGEVLLIRLPDRDGGKGKVTDRYDPEGGVLEVTFLPLVDRKDVVLEVAQNHGPGGRVLRVLGDELEEISDALAGRSNTPDLDGDGVPEIVWGGYVGQRGCGSVFGAGVLRWNGHRYDSDGRNYAALDGATGGTSSGPYDFPIPDSSVTPKPRRYVLHVWRQRGVKTVRVLIDGKKIAPETPLRLADGCHTFALRVTGTSEAMAWALLEGRR